MNYSSKVNPFRMYRICRAVLEKNEARQFLMLSREAGFSLPVIRRALLDHYNIRIASLVNGNGVKESSLYAAVSGERLSGEKAEKAMEIIARALKLKVPELFPDADDSAQPGSGN